MIDQEPHLNEQKKPLLKSKPLAAGLAAGCVMLGMSYYYIHQPTPAASTQNVTAAKAGISLPGLTHEEELAALQKMQLSGDEYAKLSALLNKREIRVVVMPVRSPANFPRENPASVLISSGLHSEVKTLNEVYQPVTLVLDKAGLVTFTLTTPHKMQVPLQARDSFGPVMLPPLTQPASPVTIGVIAQ